MRHFKGELTLIPQRNVQFVFGFANRGTDADPNWLAVRLFATRDS